MPKATDPQESHSNEDVPHRIGTGGDGGGDGDDDDALLEATRTSPSEASSLLLVIEPPLSEQALTNSSNSVLLASMVDLTDVCRLSLLSRATWQHFGRRARKACLTVGAGVPEDRRLDYWKCVLNVEKVCSYQMSDVSTVVPKEQNEPCFCTGKKASQ